MPILPVQLRVIHEVFIDIYYVNVLWLDHCPVEAASP